MQAVGEDSVSSVNGSIIMNYSKTKMAILALSASIALISCTTTQVDTSIGGAAGAGLGYAVGGGWGALIGGGAGALVGHQIGQNQ